jgi:HEAT repeat protein
MAKPPSPHSVEARLDRLVALRADPAAAGVRDELAKALRGNVTLLAAKAAALVAEFRRTDLVPELVAAFRRFLKNPKCPDKGCRATTAIARALFDLGTDADRVDGVQGAYLAGIRHVQTEWNGSRPEDAAAELRGICAFGLTRMGYRDVLVELTDLLCDPVPQARAAAARALAATGQDAAALLLRLKLLTGDAEPDVTAECLGALTKLWPQRAVSFVATFLGSHEEAVRDAAALALGESRQPAALEALRAAWDRGADPDFRRPLLLAVALLRLPESLAFLLEQVRAGRAADAAAAVEALGIYKHDAAARAQVEAAVNGRGEGPPVRAFRRAFPETRAD